MSNFFFHFLLCEWFHVRLNSLNSLKLEHWKIPIACIIHIESHGVICADKHTTQTQTQRKTTAICTNALIWCVAQALVFSAVAAAVASVVVVVTKLPFFECSNTLILNWPLSGAAMSVKMHMRFVRLECFRKHFSFYSIECNCSHSCRHIIREKKLQIVKFKQQTNINIGAPSWQFMWILCTYVSASAAYALQHKTYRKIQINVCACVCI